MILHEYSLDAERARAVDQSCNHPTTMILNQHIALPADRSPAKISQKHAASGGMPCLSLFYKLGTYHQELGEGPTSSRACNVLPSAYPPHMHKVLINQQPN